jgi:hypothetical protein
VGVVVDAVLGFLGTYFVEEAPQEAGRESRGSQGPRRDASALLMVVDARRKKTPMSYELVATLVNALSPHSELMGMMETFDLIERARTRNYSGADDVVIDDINDLITRIDAELRDL